MPCTNSKWCCPQKMRTVVQGLGEDSGLVRHSFSHRTAVQQSSTVTTDCPISYLREYSTYVFAGVLYVFSSSSSVVVKNININCCRSIEVWGKHQHSAHTRHRRRRSYKHESVPRVVQSTTASGFRIFLSTHTLFVFLADPVLYAPWTPQEGRQKVAHMPSSEMLFLCFA